MRPSLKAPLFLAFLLLFDALACSNVFNSPRRGLLSYRTRSRSLSVELATITEGKDEDNSGVSTPKEVVTRQAEGEDFEIVDASPNIFAELANALNDVEDSDSEVLLARKASVDEDGESLMYKSFLTTTTSETDSLLGSGQFASRPCAYSIFDDSPTLGFLESSSQKLADAGAHEPQGEYRSTVFSEFVVSETNSEAGDEPGDPFSDDFLGDINVDWVRHKLVPHFNSHQRLNLFFATSIVNAAYDRFRLLDTLQDIEIREGERLILVGDIHGQYDDLISIFKQHGYPSERNKYLFNGDLVDRGPKSVEVMLTLFALKLAESRGVFITRGNHETLQCGGFSSFRQECHDKMSDDFFELSHITFSTLPLGYIISGSFFVCHGGLPAHLDVEAFKEVHRRLIQGDDVRIANALMWNDPRDRPGMNASERGGMVQTFGPDVTRDFLHRHGYKLLIRSHELVPEGYAFCHGGLCLTVFSAPNYCGIGNRAAVMIIDDKLDYTFSTINQQPWMAAWLDDTADDAIWSIPAQKGNNVHFSQFSVSGTDVV